ncbi:hypothetical protein LTR37_008691 [Vermiconidia calcicola]|uniref:Uncharacterized protein n=1 Tax=Vermiconidia calcicola TaxID=1690605 RepID=A0ACC3N9R6_9PEZI|nr:hypothetical protein LTR37_008691 [Vermiconidia calcicola]
MSFTRKLRYPALGRHPSIRVLTLAPGGEEQPLTGSLIDVSFAVEPVLPYECLSYTWASWDEPDDEPTILVDNCTLQIPRNLCNFLIKLRREDGSRTLWMDSVCINQADSVEKGQQVRLMGDIYSRATHVLSWVGEHRDRSEELFYPWPSCSKGYSGLRESFGKLPSLLEQSHRRKIWTAFLSRKYFTRTWIIQEVVLAKEVYIHCGDDVSSWEDLFQSRVEVPGQIPKINALGLPSFRGRAQVEPRFDLDGVVFGDKYSDQLHLVRMICYAKFARGGLVNENRTSLRKLVERYGVLTDCSNPVDKVYAFLAMQSPLAGPSPILPNYGAGKADVLIQLLFYDDYIANPLPYMSLLDFTYEDDCHLMDFLLDEYELRFATVLVDHSSQEPWSLFYDTFIDWVQAMYTSGKRSGSWRLGKGLPPNIEWYKYPLRNANGRRMLPPERDMERLRRYTADKNRLWQAREALRPAGHWAHRSRTAGTLDLSGARHPKVGFNQSAGQTEAQAQGSWMRGTQPVPMVDEKNRQIHQGRWYEGSKQGAWTRPSAINTKRIQEEFELPNVQYYWTVGHGR